MIVRVYIGVIGSGKNYKAERECSKTIAFADQVREDIWTILGWRPETDEQYEEFKNSKWVLPGGIEFTGRTLLTRYGTDLRRNEDSNHWVKCISNKITDLLEENKHTVIGITDCRFPNEIEGLLYLEKATNITLHFIHCDYKSDKYNSSFDHESENLAQHFAGVKYTPLEFHFLIKSMFKR